MSKTHGDGPEIVITAVFCEPFTAANAIRELMQVGFEDADIDLIGVLAGPWPNSRSLSDIGVPAEHSSYYQACFEDGGVLLIVRVRQWVKKQIASTVLEQQGGILPPTGKIELARWFFE